MQSHKFIAIPMEAVERHLTPQHGETHERLKRMGAVNDEGSINLEGIRTLNVPFAATLYDNLLENGEDVLGIADTLAELCAGAEITGMYLYLCLLYARIGEIIPEPVQWISGEREALFAFCEELTDMITSYLLEDGFLCDEDGSENGRIIPIESAIPCTNLDQI